MINITLLFAALIFAEPSRAQFIPTFASLNPHKTWRVLETENFEIIYNEDDRLVAEKFAAEAEHAHQTLQPIFQVPQKRKTHLVVADITDQANGSAAAIPEKKIEVYPVFPSSTDPISEYEDWPRELLMHEYTHILNLEPTSGVMGVFRFIFGSIFKPNSFLPRWYTEGLAVEMESRFTKLGRGKSYLYSAFLRAEIEGGKLGKETIDRINATSIPEWPRGQRPYTYGYFLLNFMGHQYARKNPGQEVDAYKILNDRFSARFPYFINSPVEDVYTVNFEKLMGLTYDRLGKNYGGQLEKLKNSGAANGTSLKQPGYFNFGAQISPDHKKMAAIVSNFNQERGVYLWERDNPKVSFSTVEPKRIFTANGITQISWRGDSDTLVFDKIDTFEHFSDFSDLYEFKISEKKEDKLTSGARAREATVLSDNSLVFVKLSANKTQLIHGTSKGEPVKIINAPPMGHRLSAPRPYLKGVIYSHRDDQGREWIEWSNLETGETKKLTFAEDVGETHLAPMPDPSEPVGFYYASANSGVMNIYRHLKSPSRAVTNVTTYATSPVVDETTGDLIYARLTHEGFKLETVPSSQSPSLSKVDSVHGYPKVTTTQVPKVKITDEGGYYGVSYLFPQFWFPFVYFVPGGALFSASTSGNDPLYHHQYSLSAGYDTRAQKPTVGFSYLNGSLPFPIETFFTDDRYYLVGAQDVQHITTASISTSHYLQPNGTDWVLGPDVVYRMKEYPGVLTTQFGPGAHLSYSNVAKIRDYQISPESGHAFSASYLYFLKEWGNTEYPNFSGRALKYFSGKPLPDHHVIKLNVDTWIAPDNLSVFTAGYEGGGEYLISMFPSRHAVRGYPVGEFLGTSLYTGNFEYRFPLSYVYSGSGTTPVFAKKWHGAVVFDAITLKGGYYDNATTPGTLRATKIGTFYTSAGGELKGDLDLLYHIPITVRVGVHYGFTNKAYGGIVTLLGLGTSL